jgi:hypothetical protein
MHTVQPPLREAPLRLPRPLHPGRPLAPFSQRSAAVAALLRAVSRRAAHRRRTPDSAPPVLAVARLALPAAHGAPAPSAAGSTAGEAPADQPESDSATSAAAEPSAPAADELAPSPVAAQDTASTSGAQQGPEAPALAPLRPEEQPEDDAEPADSAEHADNAATAAAKAGELSQDESQYFTPAIVTPTRLVVLKSPTATAETERHNAANLYATGDARAVAESASTARTKLERLPAIAATSMAHPIFDAQLTRSQMFAVDASRAGNTLHSRGAAVATAAPAVAPQSAPLYDAARMSAVHGPDGSLAVDAEQVACLLDAPHALLMRVELQRPATLLLHYAQPAFALLSGGIEQSPLLLRTVRAPATAERRPADPVPSTRDTSDAVTQLQDAVGDKGGADEQLEASASVDQDAGEAQEQEQQQDQEQKQEQEQEQERAPASADGSGADLEPAEEQAGQKEGADVEAVLDAAVDAPLFQAVNSGEERGHLPWRRVVRLQCSSEAEARALAAALEGRRALEQIARQCRRCAQVVLPVRGA